MSFRPPSTPNSRSIRTAPSTTPAGNPPSYLTNKSTTPAGPPPRVPFGSSFNPANNTFGKKNISFEVPEDGYSDADGDFVTDADLEMSSFPASQSFMSSLPPTSPRGLKRSRDGKVREQGYISALVPGKLRNKRLTALKESDKVVLQTEAILSSLDGNVQKRPADINFVLSDTAAQFTKLWKLEADPATRSGTIGPASKDGFNKANYIASLLLALHYPHTDKPGKAAVRGPRTAASAQVGVPVPKALLDWLETYHRPFEDDYETVRDNEPTPAAHESFWDAVYGSFLRGKLDHVIFLLRNAGLEYAATAEDDVAGVGYTGQQLKNARLYLEKCALALQSCPGLRYNDWDVKNHDWKLFRQSIKSALDDLEVFASEDQGQHFKEPEANIFNPSLSASGMNMSTQSRRALSPIPWSIYENLKLLYNLALGSPEEILMVSQDWLEGSLYWAIWWDGEDEQNFSGSLNRSSMRMNARQKPRPVDVNTCESYRDRLSFAFARVTAEEHNPDPDPVFVVDTMDMVQVALGCVLEDAMGAVVEILQTWSMPVTVAIVEIAALGKWLPSVRPRSSEGLLNFNVSKEDLLVLSTGLRRATDPAAVDRDEILGDYANLLVTKDMVMEKEGWELAVAVLNRFDQEQNGAKRILGLLDQLDLNDEARVDKVLGVCDALALADHRNNIAERFADTLAGSNESHGAALVYYARAHAAAKLKAHVEVLTSLCLLHSAAVPAQSQLDAKLRSLLGQDRSIVKDLARTDMEAATLLTSLLSGYATLRKFYDTRDQEFYISQGVVVDHPLRTLERRRQAATSLFAVIQSAADCIHGGLFDPEIESVVPVDGLLALFGEALPLLGQDVRVFTQQQVFSLLGLVEDFVTSPSRIRENADSLLKASLNAYKEGTSTASGIFRKSRGDLSASSSWDMMASTMAQSQGAEKLQRAWDWRQGLVGASGIEADCNGVIQLLREALIREVAGGWSGGLNW